MIKNVICMVGRMIVTGIHFSITSVGLIGYMLLIAIKAIVMTDMDSLKKGFRDTINAVVDYVCFCGRYICYGSTDEYVVAYMAD